MHDGYQLLIVAPIKMAVKGIPRCGVVLEKAYCSSHNSQSDIR